MSYLFVQITQFGTTGEKHLTAAELRADKEWLVTRPDKGIVAWSLAAVDEMPVKSRVGRSEGETRKWAAPFTMVVGDLKCRALAEWLCAAKMARGQGAEDRAVTLGRLESVNKNVFGDIRRQTVQFINTTPHCLGSQDEGLGVCD